MVEHVAHCDSAPKSTVDVLFVNSLPLEHFVLIKLFRTSARTKAGHEQLSLPDAYYLHPKQEKQGNAKIDGSGSVEGHSWARQLGCVPPSTIHDGQSTVNLNRIDSSSQILVVRED